MNNVKVTSHYWPALLSLDHSTGGVATYKSHEYQESETQSIHAILLLFFLLDPIAATGNSRPHYDKKITPIIRQV